MQEANVDHEPWFGLEQEYFLVQDIGTTSVWPYAWPLDGFPAP